MSIPSAPPTKGLVGTHLDNSEQVIEPVHLLAQHSGERVDLPVLVRLLEKNKVCRNLSLSSPILLLDSRS